MIDQLQAVAKFQKAFGQSVKESPTLIPFKSAELRYKLMAEENEEYLQAVSDNDIIEVADALTDKLYILCGTILEHGMQYVIEDCFNNVQNSNMSKLDDDGKPIINGRNGVNDNTRPLGKILKSKNFIEPNLEPILNKPKDKNFNYSRASYSELNYENNIQKSENLVLNSNRKSDRRIMLLQSAIIVILILFIYFKWKM